MELNVMKNFAGGDTAASSCSFNFKYSFQHFINSYKKEKE
jgi:hypothetical protein